MKISNKIDRKFSRREVIKRVGLLLGVSVPLSQLEIIASSFAVSKGKNKPQFFGNKEFALLTQITDLVIPRTDTPGAIDAGVHVFIDMMLAQWASNETQSKYLNGLKGIDKEAKLSFGANFIECADDQKIGLLKKLDNMKETANNQQQSFFSELKWFVVEGYYSTEEGASIELNYDRMPGKYKGCLPFDEQGRAWS